MYRRDTGVARLVENEIHKRVFALNEEYILVTGK